MGSAIEVEGTFTSSFVEEEDFVVLIACNLAIVGAVLLDEWFARIVTSVDVGHFVWTSKLGVVRV